MPRKSFTPVSVRRRSAAQGCANAHTDTAAPAGGCFGRIDVGVGPIRRLVGSYRADERLQNMFYYTFLTPGNNPVNVL